MFKTQPQLNIEQIYKRLNITPEILANFCQKNHIVELSLFGSVLREDFNDNSDIDMLVVFNPNSTTFMSLMDLVKIQYELEDMIQRKIDLIEKRSIIDSHNWIRRKNILTTAQIIYESKPSYLLDIAKFCQTILRLTHDMTEADFYNDERTQLAVLYEITIIGEVVKRLSPEFREQHSQIQWRQIAGMRDRLVHDYDQVKLDLVWQVIKNNIPELLVYITPLIPTDTN